jgi:hypothetical protein
MSLPWCQIRVALSASLFSGLLGMPHTAAAMSKLFEHDGRVVLRNGVPCFFSDNFFNKEQWAGFNVYVAAKTPSTSKFMWLLSTDRSKEVPMPDSAERCVLYGNPRPLSTVVNAPALLQEGVPYLFVINAGDHNEHGEEFCLGRSPTGEPLLTKWNYDGSHCSDEPLNEADRPSLWKRLLGK